MAPPSISTFLCINAAKATTIYPVIWDQSGKTSIWSGKGIKEYQIGPNEKKTVDITTITPGPLNQQVIVLGCGFEVAGTEKFQNDTANTKTYSQDSTDTATGTKTGENESGGFSVNPASMLSVETTAIRDVLLKANTAKVAKLLAALAALIELDA